MSNTNWNYGPTKVPSPVWLPLIVQDNNGNQLLAIDSSGVNIFGLQDATTNGLYVEKKNGSGTLLGSGSLDFGGNWNFRTDAIIGASNTGSAAFTWNGITGTWTFSGGTLNKLLVGTGASQSYIDGTNGIVMAGNSGSAVALDGVAAALKISGLAVVGARSTGWTAWTGTAAKGSFDTATATLVNVAQAVKAITDALRTHGLIGT